MRVTSREVPLTAAHDHLAEIVDAAHEGRVVYLTRDGRRWAAVVPVAIAEAFEAIQAAEDAEDNAAADAALAEEGESIPWDEVKAELGR